MTTTTDPKLVAAAAAAADDPLWYRDAIIYELRTRSFYDSNGDGIGDLAGLAEKLDYIKDLGVTAIWLLPLCPSPGRDDGYDIADYMDVHPDVGTLNDLRLVIDEAKKRGIRIITELVMNHTSDQHPWFQRARVAPAGSPERDFYVWSETPERYVEARIIFKDFEPSNWTWDRTANAYYWHRFFSHQPDLNFENPAVHAAMFEVVDFWFGLGVDGLRLDAVPYLYEEDGTNCENLPRTHAFLRELRAHIDTKWKNRMLLAEANQWPEDAAAYFGAGDECHMNFHFPLMPRMFMALEMEDRFPIIDILAQTPPVPPGCQWAMFLRNHDELTLEMVTEDERDYMYRVYASETSMRLNLGIRRRLAPLVGNDRRKMELLNGLLLSMPGTPVLYYGDEIGMGDNVYLGDRNGVRTPMQWNSDRNAGFSRANPQRLVLPVIIDPEYHFEAVNVETQQNNTHSLLWWTKRLIALRKQHQAFGRGTIEFLNPDNSRVLSFVRQYEGETILVVVNLSRFVQHVELDLSKHQGCVPVELFGRTRFPAVGDHAYPLTLGSFAFYWLALDTPRGGGAEARLSGFLVPHVETASLQALTLGADGPTLQRALPRFIESRPWFRSGHRAIASARIVDAIRLGEGGAGIVATLATVEYMTGEPETYMLPLAFVPKSDPRTPASETVFANAHVGGVEGVIVDALDDAPSARPLLDALRRGDRVRGGAGELHGIAFEEVTDAGGDAKAIGAKHSNAAVQYDDKFLLKVYRRLEAGRSTELDAGRLLSAQAPGLTAAIVGTIEYRQGRGEPSTLAVLQRFVPNEGTAWQQALAEVGRFYERVVASHTEQVVPPEPQGALASHGLQELPQVLGDTLGMGPFAGAARLLGSRTADMHIALASSSDPAFAPEPFSSFDRRSIYQSFRNLIGRVERELRIRRADLDADTQALAEQLVGREALILERIAPMLHADMGGQRIRIHGDYHLGQVLNTGKDYVLIDFDGDASTTLSQRRRKRSALRDVAQMVRSFRYAAHTGRLEGVVRDEDRARLFPWEAVWAGWAAVAFVGGYFERAKDARFLPSADAIPAILDRLLLERALHELQDWVNGVDAAIDVPIADILRMTAT